ncbi:glycosyltransferase family protein [Sphingomonas aliaeris]|uniref:hypothetical protein n=1 Tax=Sphingomonas aliaeris TaxID=2759526 RepID=UPI001CEDDD0C|nr:hypothetical protein [Sphingomonas aliaeris]
MIGRALKPVWLSAPSRYAGIAPTRARWVFAALALLLAASLTAIIAPGPPPVSQDASTASRADDQADVVLYRIDRRGASRGRQLLCRHRRGLAGGRLSAAPVRHLPSADARGDPVAPARTGDDRLALPARGRRPARLVWAVAQCIRAPPPRLIALILLAAGMVVFVQSDLAGFHEVWAGLLVALSLALRRPGRWVEAVAIGMVAMLIRETAALYVAIMAVMAFAEGRRRESWAWAGTLAMLAIVVILHARAVGQVVRPLDPASPGWSGMLGFGFFVKTMGLSTALNLAPGWIAALLVGLALFGWSAWRDMLALRALAMFCGYAALLALFGRVDTFYWGLMIAPTILIGLAFVPDALRDLAAAARDRRKITVTRLTL